MVCDLVSCSCSAIRRANCFHHKGHGSPCAISSTPYMIIFGVAEIFFSQIPDFDQISWLSILAAVMSFTYSTIGLGLGIVQVIGKQARCRPPVVAAPAAAMFVPQRLITRARMRCSEQRRAGQPDGHQHRRGDPDGQGVAQPAGVRRHRLRLLLLAHPHRDPGHHPGAAAVGVHGDEARHGGQRRGDHALLHALRLHGVRGLRRRRAGKPPHGLRLLRALLAPRRRQRRHRRAPRRRLPGLLPAALRLRPRSGRSRGGPSPGTSPARSASRSPSPAPPAAATR